MTRHVDAIPGSTLVREPVRGAGPGVVRSGAAHLTALTEALATFGEHVELIDRWGRELLHRLRDGGRLLAVGNGGSAAQAQHLTAEIVGRYAGDRRPFSAVALHAEPSALTAILNDYGPEHVFARQVLAHGRPGDVLIALSTSGGSTNVIAATRAARAAGLTTWVMTGPEPNPLATTADEALAVEAPETAIVQELHLVGLHLLCAAFDEELGRSESVLEEGQRPGQATGAGRTDDNGWHDEAQK